MIFQEKFKYLTYPPICIKKHKKHILNNV